MEGTPAPPRRARHLMDPSQPRKPTSPEDLVRLDRVQRWVLSVLAVTTIGHLSLGLVLAALTITEDSPGAQIGLCVLAATYRRMSAENHRMRVLAGSRAVIRPLQITGLYDLLQVETVAAGAA